MSKDFYVYSTLPSGMDYTSYSEGGGDLPVASAVVRINGGTGIPNRQLVTPRGVVTKITARQAELLREIPLFQLHEKNGYVTISDKAEDPEKVVAEGMEARSPDAPLEPGDFEGVPESVAKPAAAKSNRKA